MYTDVSACIIVGCQRNLISVLLSIMNVMLSPFTGVIEQALDVLTAKVFYLVWLNVMR